MKGTTGKMEMAMLAVKRVASRPHNTFVECAGETTTILNVDPGFRHPDGCATARGGWRNCSSGQ